MTSGRTRRLRARYDALPERVRPNADAYRFQPLTPPAQ